MKRVRVERFIKGRLICFFMSENKYELRTSQDSVNIVLKRGLEGTLKDVLVSERGDVVYGPRETLKFYGEDPCSLYGQYGFRAERVRELNRAQLEKVGRKMGIPVEELSMVVEIENSVDFRKDVLDAGFLEALRKAKELLG